MCGRVWACGRVCACRCVGTFVRLRVCACLYVRVGAATSGAAAGDGVGRLAAVRCGSAERESMGERGEKGGAGDRINDEELSRCNGQ